MAVIDKFKGGKLFGGVCAVVVVAGLVGAALVGPQVFAADTDSGGPTAVVPEKKIVTPGVPSVDGNEVTLKKQDGVIYSIGGKGVDFDDNGVATFNRKPGEYFTVHASPAIGYEFPKDTVNYWNLRIDKVLVAPTAPTNVINYVTITKTPGVDYKITDSGDPLNPMVINFDDDGKATFYVNYKKHLTVKATPSEGYRFDGYQEREWSFYDESKLVHPTEPTRIGDTVIVVATKGVKYADGNGGVISFDDNGTKTYVLKPFEWIKIKAIPESNYHFDDKYTIKLKNFNPQMAIWGYTGRKIVTPAAPTKSGNKVTVTATRGVEYAADNKKIDFMGADKLELPLKPNQEIVIVATPDIESKFKDEQPSEEWKFVGDRIIAVPAAPTKDGDTITVTATRGVDYVADDKKVDFKGNPKTTIPLKPNQKITIVATPDNDHKFEGNQSRDWKFVGDRNIVTPVDPTKANNTVTVTATPGVEYAADGEKVDFKNSSKITFPLKPNQKITIVATPDINSKFADDKTSKEWKFVGDRNIVTPADPTKANNTVTVTATTGVEYAADGKKVDFKGNPKTTIPLKPNQKITIVATPDVNSKFADDKTSKEWGFVGDKILAVPATPTKNGNGIEFTAIPGVEYTADNKKVDFKGNPKTTIPLKPNQKIIVAATPDNDHKFDGDQSREWKFVGDRNIVTPADPTKANNIVTVTATTGVEYAADGKKVDFKGENKVTFPLKPNQKITVVATPDINSKFADGKSSKEWDLVGDKILVTPADPTKANNEVTITQTPGVEYAADGKKVDFKGNTKVTIPLKPNQKITVAATPDNDHVFDGNQSREWELVGDKILVTPADPTKANNEVTITQTPGVEYAADGKKIDFKGGNKVTFPLKPNQKITVAATPDNDHVFDGNQSREWELVGDKILVTPAAPTGDGNTVTVTATSGVNYSVDGEKVDFKGEDKVAFTIGDGKEITVVATPGEEYEFEGNEQSKDWKFTWVAPAPKPTPVDTKQSNAPKPKPVDTKQPNTPKPKPAPAVVKPAERDNTQSKRPTVVVKTVDNKQSDKKADTKQSGSVKKKEALPNTGAGVAVAGSLAVAAVLFGVGVVVFRRKLM